MEKRELNFKEKIFAERYVETMCPRTAALAAGYSLPTARGRAYQWVSCREHKPWQYDYIQELLEAKRGKFSISTQQVLHRLWLIASADPNELIELRRVNCRYCWGEAHGYQWVEREFLGACALAESKGKVIPDYAGGFGFNSIADPHPECPECHGEGEQQLAPKDTRDLSPAARALYAGIEQTRDGIKIKTHDQLTALLNLGKHLGMFVDRKELSGPGGAPLLAPGLIAALDPNDAAKAYADMVKGG